jgi:uncharacterized protein (DUF2252 family)
MVSNRPPGTRAPRVRLPALAERKAAGKALRGKHPRSALARYELPPGRNVVRWLQASNKGRIEKLIPIRYGRMLHSPFAFLRGAAAVMANDIGPLPNTGIRTQLCGDCHLANFGGFASPERSLQFGINDFDETLPGPFEWDVQRLATSFAVAVRAQGLTRRAGLDAARAAARAYREHMARFAQMHALDLWYTRIEVDALVQLARSVETRKLRRRMVAKARHSSMATLFPRLAEAGGGLPRFSDHPPLIYHPRHIPDFEQNVHIFWRRYVETLPEERRALVARYRLVDVAIKVVGVGSVGTRCAIALLLADRDDPLVLQFKQARRSVLEPYAGASAHANQGLRVVIGQRLMQAASDIFLGFSHATHLKEDFYVRQLRDMKVSLELEHLSGGDFLAYAELCGWELARAHAKAGDAAEISGYLGKSDEFERTIGKFAMACAEQTERDHAALEAAVKAGRIHASVEDST